MEKNNKKKFFTSYQKRIILSLLLAPIVFFILAGKEAISVGSIFMVFSWGGFIFSLRDAMNNKSWKLALLSVIFFILAFIFMIIAFPQNQNTNEDLKVKKINTNQGSF